MAHLDQGRERPPGRSQQRPGRRKYIGGTPRCTERHVGGEPLQQAFAEPFDLPESLQGTERTVCPPVLQDAPHHLSYAARALYLFLAFILASPIGLLMALAPEAAYDYYVEGGGLWGLGAHADQQLAGVTMAMEQAIVFFGVFAIFFFRFLADEENGQSPAGTK